MPMAHSFSPGRCSRQTGVYLPTDQKPSSAGSDRPNIVSHGPLNRNSSAPLKHFNIPRSQEGICPRLSSTARIWASVHGGLKVCLDPSTDLNFNKIASQSILTSKRIEHCLPVNELARCWVLPVLAVRIEIGALSSDECNLSRITSPICVWNDAVYMVPYGSRRQRAVIFDEG